MNGTAQSVASPIKRANEARNEAVKRLIAKHEEEWKEFILEERRSRGLFGLPGEQRVPLRQQVAEQAEELERLRQIMKERGIEVPN